MEQLYFINHKRFQKGDTKRAWLFATELLKSHKDIDTITFLVYQSQQYDSFLCDELGFTTKQCMQHIYPNKSGYKIQIHTVRTYNPQYISSDEEGRELLLIIGVPSKDLISFVDKSRVKYWILVPWIIEENLSLLSVFDAIDIETNKRMCIQYSLDGKIKHAIEWIKSTSYPNEGFNHPSDEDRLKQMSNTLKHYHIPFEYDAVVHYCVNHGIIYTSAIQIADYFYKAQKRKFATLDGTDYKFLKTMLDRTDWE